jgi:hypothetical protein
MAVSENQVVTELLDALVSSQNGDPPVAMLDHYWAMFTAGKLTSDQFVKLVEVTDRLTVVLD